MKVSISKNLGCYNWADTSQKSWLVSMRIDDLAISEQWDADSEPEIKGLPPSEVVELISERLEKYWINTDRERKREVIKQIKANKFEIDKAWANSEILRLQRSHQRIHNEINSFRYLIQDINEQMIDAGESVSVPETSSKTNDQEIEP